MRIWSGMTQGAPRLSENKGSKSSSLKKSEIIADIFNHKPVESDERKSTKLHLSNTSKALHAQHCQEVRDFLKENETVESQLREIELDPEGSGSGDAVMTRKLGSYVSWLRIREHASEDSSAAGEAPYRAIHAEGKDEEIKALVDGNEQRRQKINADRKQFMPNYYYMVYPETYSFN